MAARSQYRYIWNASSCVLLLAYMADNAPKEAIYDENVTLTQVY